MKRIIVSAANLSSYTPQHPERTAYRPATGALNFDYIIQEWPNRESMLRTIAMQESGSNFRKAWKDWSKSRMYSELNKA